MATHGHNDPNSATTLAFDGRDHAQAHASVAAGGLNEDVTRLNSATPRITGAALSMVGWSKSAWWYTVYLPIWKIWKSLGIIIPNIWKNKKMFQSTNQKRNGLTEASAVCSVNPWRCQVSSQPPQPFSWQYGPDKDGFTQPGIGLSARGDDHFNQDDTSKYIKHVYCTVVSWLVASS